MKALSDTKPNKLNIDNIGGWAHISLCDNIISVEDGYEYDYYMLKVPNRANLENDILENFDLWVDKAKALDNKIELSVDDRIGALEDVINLLLEL